MNGQASKFASTSSAASPWMIALLATQLCGCLEMGAPARISQSGSGVSLTSPDFVAVDEQISTGFYTATASAGDGQPARFSVAGGADGARFSIDSTSGVLSFTTPPNFERPMDVNGDNTYEVELQAEAASGRSSRRLVRVQVTDINEAPIFTSRRNLTILENSLVPYWASAVDPDFDRVTYAIDGGADADLFSIDPVSGRLAFNEAPDFEDPRDANRDNRYQLSLVADDGRGLTSNLGVEIRVSDESKLRIQVGFPTPGANLGGIDDTAVTGRVQDVEDGTVQFADIDYIDVNGSFASQPLSDASRWTASAAASFPETSLLASVRSANGVTNSTAGLQQNEAVIVSPDLMVFGPEPDRLLVADRAGIGSLVSLDLSAGTRSLVPGIAEGSGPPLLFPQAADFDGALNRILVLDAVYPALMSIDLATGDRAFLSGAGIGTGPEFDFPASLTLDTASNRILVLDTNLAAVISVDPLTGDRSVISDSVTGSGIPLVFPTVLTLDPAAGRALVADAFHEAIIAVDLASGDRTVVADAGSGTEINFPIALALDADNDRLIVLDFNLQAVVSVDLLNGGSVLLSGPMTGSGPETPQPRSMALDLGRDRVLVTDVTLKEMLSVDLSTGDRTPFAVSTTGTGPSLSAGSALAFDPTGNRLLVAHRQAGGGGLIGVSLDGGARSALSGSANGTGAVIDAVTGLELDVANDRVLVTDDDQDALAAIDLATGDRTILSSAGTGTGPLFGEPVSVAFDALSDRALVLDRALNALLAVDLASGNRSVVSSAGERGNGPALSDPVGVGLDTGNNRALVADAGLAALVQIDLSTGDRVVVADGTLGAGPALDGITAVAIDSLNNVAFAAVGNNPSAIYAIDLSSGNREIVVSPSDSLGPPLLAVTGLRYDPEYDRLFVLDSGMEAALVVGPSTGQRAVVSR